MLNGFLKLDVNTADVRNNCFSVPGINSQASCEVLNYAMKDAYNDKEPLMLSLNNYISAIEFELAEYNSFTGVTTKYTKDWESVDEKFRKMRTWGDN